MATVIDGEINAECGPASASAGPIWGPWSPTEDTAVAAALARARRFAASQCGGSCPDVTQSCKYREAESSIDGFEEQKNPDTGQIEYRAQASSSGSCVCQ